VEAFQRDHGLHMDGKAGPATQAKLRELTQPQQQQGAGQHAPASTPIPGITDPAHPGNAMFQQAQIGMQKIDAEHGRASDARTVNASAALAACCFKEGLTRIDHVALGTDAANLFAIEGNLNSPFKKIASVPTVQSLETPVAQSTQEWNRAAQEKTQEQSQTQLQTQTQQHAQPAMSM
jgi:putative chitinase